MSRFRIFLFSITGIPILILLIWFIAIPDSVIKTAIEDAISNQGRIQLNPSINGLRKGLFFTVYADSLALQIDGKPALIVTDISSRINLLYLFKKQFAFSLKGKIGTGDIEGAFKLPESGSLNIDGAEFSAIPYLASLGLQGRGLISGNLILRNNVADATFQIPDADIRSLTPAIPLPITSFRKIQGAMQLRGDNIIIPSISLEADKGHARLKGEVIAGNMNLILELMPNAGKLEPFESILISRYLVSPGYYVIPIKKSVL